MASKDTKSTRVLTYVHGTNGSGKSTLARYLIMCAGGIRSIHPHPRTGAKCTYTYGPLALVGKYSTATGGADGVQPYSLVPQTALALLEDGRDVLVEGLMTPGVDTCADLYRKARKLGASVRFIRLDIGFYQSCENVKRRRHLVGNDKPFDPINLRKKQNTCQSWFGRLADAKLPIYGFNWENARDYCLSAYRINPNGAIRVLDL